MKIMPALVIELSDWFEAIFIKNIPGLLGIFIRRAYWSARFGKNLRIYIGPGCAVLDRKNVSLGKNIMLLQECSFYAHNFGKIYIGDRLSVNCRVMIDASDNGQIIIGNDVSIGPNVVIRASNHGYKSRNVQINKQGHTGGKIVIGDDVWIGANCVILPGAIIGQGSVIGAGAVVNKEIPSYSLAGGVPARVIKENCRE